MRNGNLSNYEVLEADGIISSAERLLCDALADILDTEPVVAQRTALEDNHDTVETVVELGTAEYRTLAVEEIRAHVEKVTGAKLTIARPDVDERKDAWRVGFMFLH